MEFDRIIQGGELIDGTKSPSFRADVGIRGDRISAVGDLTNRSASELLDARGRVVAPGFIDVHNHSDGWLLKLGHLVPKTTQGFTTEVIMADGISYAPVNDSTAHEWMFYLRSLNGLQATDYNGWKSLADYMSRLDGATAQNVACHIPYANVRSLVCGFSRQPVDGFQMRQMQSEIQRGMEAGAVGVSTGLDYIVECFSTADEIAEACRPVAEHGGLYVTHVRYKKGLLAALNEAGEICRKAGMKLHISHLKGQPPTANEQIFDCLDQASRDLEVSYDVYPYQPGSTMLNFLLPYEVWEEGPLAALGKLGQPRIRQRFFESMSANRWDLEQMRIAWLPSKENSPHIGKSLAQFAAAVNLPPHEAIFNLLVEERLAVLCVMHEGADRDVWPFVQHPRSMIGSDGIYFADGQVHPRMFGTAGRVLGPLVRQHRLFTLEEAVYKLSGFAAERFGLANRGVIREGAYADLVVFDPDAVSDRATYDQPDRSTVGIADVLVNGTPVVADGKPVDCRETGFPGRWVKRG